MAASLCSCLCTSLRTARSSMRPLASTSARSMQSSARVSFARPVPEKRDTIQTPTDFFKKIGRDLEEQASKVGETWEDLWRKDSVGLKKAGITAPKTRKYILRQMQLYRKGRPIRPIAAKLPKKFRGRGPRVQKGVRVR